MSNSVELNDWLDYLTESVGSPEQARKLLRAEPIDPSQPVTQEVIERYFREGRYPYAERMSIKDYHETKYWLQVELVKLQNWVKETRQKVIILFEGRDAAGKGSTIKRFMEHLNPRGASVVALEKPSERERDQWYFQRYTDHLPSAGEMVFFDRSWYNRAGVERVMGFCTEEEYWEFTRQAPAFERMLVRSGITIFKFYLSVTREEQARRFKDRELNPLKQWKLSPIDIEAQKRWDSYTEAKNSTFRLTNFEEAEWVIIKSDDKLRAQINTMKHVLNQFQYTGRTDTLDLTPDPLLVAPAGLVFNENTG